MERGDRDLDVHLVPSGRPGTPLEEATLKPTEEQLSLPFEEAAKSRKPTWERFPQTRYLGSKRKLLPLLERIFRSLEFETALDPFSGTASGRGSMVNVGAGDGGADEPPKGS